MTTASDPRQARIAVALAGVLLLAGCGGLGGPGPREPTPTASPAPVPDASPGTATDATAAGTELPVPVPGLVAGADGVRVDAARLGRAHDRALADAGSYRRSVALTVLLDDGTAVARDREAVLADRAAGRYLVVESPRLAPGPFDEPVEYRRFVTDGTRYAYRRFANGTRRVDRAPAAEPPTGRWRVDGRELASLLARGDLRVAGRDRRLGSADSYVLAGPFPEPPQFGLVTDPEGGRLRATVRSDGLVERVRLTYRARSGRQAVAVVLELSHDRLGTVDVARPPWADGAGPNATTAAP